MDSSNLTPAEKWDDQYSGGAAYKPLNILLLEKILKRHEELSGVHPTSALDIGCGTGDALFNLKKAGVEDVTGIDCSRVALVEASKKVGEENVICCDLNDVVLPNDGKTFDFILCKLTVAFVRDKEALLCAVAERMDERSTFCIMTPVLHDGIEYTKVDKPRIAVRYDEFKKLLEDTFDHVEEFHHDYTGERGDVVTFLVRK